MYRPWVEGNMLTPLVCPRYQIRKSAGDHGKYWAISMLSLYRASVGVNDRGNPAKDRPYR